MDTDAHKIKLMSAQREIIGERLGRCPIKLELQCLSICLGNQLDWIWNQLEDMSLGESLRVRPEKIRWGKKTLGATVHKTLPWQRRYKEF